MTAFAAPIIARGETASSTRPYVYSKYVNIYLPTCIPEESRGRGLSFPPLGNGLVEGSAGRELQVASTLGTVILVLGRYPVFGYLDPDPKARNSPRTLHNIVFGHKSF